MSRKAHFTSYNPRYIPADEDSMNTLVTVTIDVLWQDTESAFLQNAVQAALKAYRECPLVVMEKQIKLQVG